MKYTTPKIVQSEGYRRLALWVLLPLALLAMLVAGYAARVYQEASGAQALQFVIDDQQQVIADLDKERAGLTEKIVHLERSAQMDQEALGEIKAELKSYQEERSKLEEELSVLRSMLSGKGAREGVQVHRFSVKKGEAAGEYRYRFTVTQAVTNGETASGWVFIAVDGLKDGSPAWLPLRDITDEKTERIRVRFKHFQDVEGVIKLPEDFKPLKVIVEVKPSNKKLPEVKQRFDWQIKE